MDEQNKEVQPDGGWEFHPGDTISPASEPVTPAVEASEGVTPPPSGEPATTPEVITGSTESAAPEPAPVVQTATPVATAIPPEGAEGSMTWTASEFIAHHKSTGWYLALSGGALALAFLVWLLTKDKISAGVVIVGAVLLGVYGSRQPRQLQYAVDDRGVAIGQRFHSYGEFRSFAIVPEGAFSSIVFLPLKRFAPMLSIYYDPADEEKIVALLSERLPMEHRQKDLIDRLMWRIRF